MKTIKIRIKDNKIKPYIIDKVYKYRHFENMYIILLNQDYKQGTGDYNLFTDYRVMRAILRDNGGGKVKEKVKYIKEKYRDHSLMKDLIEVSKDLKVHNLVEIMKRVKSQYKGFFTKIKGGDISAKPPKTKKLSKLCKYTIPLDSSKSFTLKKKNKIGINLSKNMVYSHVKFSELEQLTGSIKNICAININFSNGDIYFLIIYDKVSSPVRANNKEPLHSGIDVGLENLLTLYIDDCNSNSLIISGKSYKTYNSNFNRFISKLNRDISSISTKIKEIDEEDLKNKLKKLCDFRKFLYEKRNRYFETEFNKVSKRITEYLISHKVTHLSLSDNLATMKTDGECKLRKDIKQNFIQIPFIKLLKMIKYKGELRGIRVNYCNEAYTSKTSAISSDIKRIQELSKNKKLSTDDFCGNRVKRGLFLDTIVNKIINADCNGAFNVCKLNVNNRKEGIRWFKLCNPVKVKSDYDLCDLLHNSKFG